MKELVNEEGMRSMDRRTVRGRWDEIITRISVCTSWGKLVLGVIFRVVERE